MSQLEKSLDVIDDVVAPENLFEQFLQKLSLDGKYDTFIENGMKNVEPFKGYPRSRYQSAGIDCFRMAKTWARDTTNIRGKHSKCK